MKQKHFLVLPMMLFFSLLFSNKVLATSGSDIQMQITSPINSLTNESGVVAVEQFPAEIPINIKALKGKLTEIKLEHNGEWRDDTI